MSDYRQRARAFMRDSRRDWYRIQNTAGGVAEIYVYDEIGFWGFTAADFVRELQDVQASEIQLHLNSPGGDVFDGIAILNALRAHDARVVVTVDGVAASAASFIAMAGNEIVMARNSEMMIHDAHGLCMGNAADMHDLGAQLDRISENIASIYADRAGGTAADWRDAMRTETWYTAQEAVAAGLADRVLPKKTDDQATARFDLSVFNYAGRAQAPAPAHQTPDASAAGLIEHQQEEHMSQLSDTLRQRLGIADENADEATILAALDEALAEAAEPAPTPTPPALPEGTVAIESTTLEELQVAARAGAAARAQQQTEQRERLVTAAVNDGRIAPARRAHWLQQLEADPGAADVLASLAPGLIPVGEPHGHAGETNDPAGTDNYWFPGAHTPAGNTVEG